MKKTILLLLLVSPVQATNITLAQAQAAQKYAFQIQSCAAQMQVFAATVIGYIQGSYAYTVSWSTTTQTLSAQQQADALAYYQNLKTNCLQAAFNQLP
jgi:hypothetical protein